MTLVVLHEGPAVNDDRALAWQVTLAAFGHLLAVIGVDYLMLASCLGVPATGLPTPPDGLRRACILIVVDHLPGRTGGGASDGSGGGASGNGLGWGLIVLVGRLPQCSSWHCCTHNSGSGAEPLDEGIYADSGSL